MPAKIAKGQLLAVKAPPYYTKEYFYEVESAGEKLVRARLYHSPKVRKSWSLEEFEVLIDMDIIRLAESSEVSAELSVVLPEADLEAESPDTDSE